MGLRTALGLKRPYAERLGQPVGPFFDRYPLFLDSSSVGNWPIRLNARYDAVIAANRAIFQDARVLDIASHDGRWSFAAIDAGARKVAGIEARASLVTAANHNLKRLGVPRNRYLFTAADVFSSAVFNQAFDVVMCLGFLYHTARHVELFELMARTGARTIVLDTMVWNAEGSSALLKSEEVQSPAHGVDALLERRDRVLVSAPTPGAVELMFDHFGYRTERVDWRPAVDASGASPGPQRKDNPLGDYAAGNRATFVAHRRN